jgi:signal transduction histidine kinase
MVERVLKLSRFEGRLNPVAEEKVDLVSVVRSALRNHEPLAEASGVHVECRVPDHPIVIAGNEESLVAALSNLIENAIHYSICQPKQIEIALTSNEASSEISVRDHGIGIPAREHQRIFERFYRVNDDAVRAVSGSGLGLAIVKAAVEAHCGTISISSRPGAGSTFIIRLPAAMNVDAAESPASLRAS